MSNNYFSQPYFDIKIAGILCHTKVEESITGSYPPLPEAIVIMNEVVLA